MIRNKKGQSVIDNLGVLVAPLIGVALVLVIGLLIMNEMKNQVSDLDSGNWCTEDGYVYNSTTQSCYGFNATQGGNVTDPSYGYGWNATDTTKQAMQDIPGWLPIIVVAIIGALILGLVQFFRSR